MKYYGSTLFTGLAGAIGFPIDETNFIVSHIFGFILSIVLRNFLKPCDKNTTKRLLFCHLCGLLIGYFCIGIEIMHIVIHAFVSYVLILFVPKKHIHIVIFIFAMGYLSCMHVHRFLYGFYALDVTGTLMINTQKLIDLGFCLNDGQKREEKLKDNQKENVIKKTPSFLEFWSYIINFQSILSGPLSFYKDYIDFIDGNNILKHQKKIDDSKTEIVQPSVVIPVIKKLIALAIIFFIYVNLCSNGFLYSGYTRKEIIRSSLLYRMFYLDVSAYRESTRYFIIFCMPEIVSNVGGFGFNGYDQNGNAKWDLLTNMDFIGFETCTTMRNFFNTWNIATHKWLKRVCYERLVKHKTIAVFALSALWHGFYPGNYFLFFHWGICLNIAGHIRRNIRPYFQLNSTTKFIYAILTYTGTRIVNVYSTAPFLIQTWDSCLEFYNSFNWSVTIFLILLNLFCVVASRWKSRNKKIDTENHEKVN